jgi:hypothetical protein
MMQPETKLVSVKTFKQYFCFIKTDTMKKVVLVLIAVVFVIGILISCNKSVCPAYVQDNKAAQVENNG